MIECFLDFFFDGVWIMIVYFVVLGVGVDDVDFVCFGLVWGW